MARREAEKIAAGRFWIDGGPLREDRRAAV
jgi:hypothetical protein